MDNRKLTATKDDYRNQGFIWKAGDEAEDSGRIALAVVQYSPDTAAELVRRWNNFPALVEALDMVQEALAAYRDGNKVLIDHPVHGPITSIEEVKYLVVDEALNAAKA